MRIFSYAFLTIQTVLLLFISSIFTACNSSNPPSSQETSQDRPNILLIISDDQSWEHASAYSYTSIQTPGFDRIAKEGVLFSNGFAASPGCSPSRAALLTGRNCWQLEAAGTHASHFDAKYMTYPDLLEKAGYEIGYTGKAWGPGKFDISGRTRNPAGPSWDKFTVENNPPGISDKNYAKNFEAFLAAKPEGKPFCFWMGGHEPHRIFDKGIGKKNGKTTEQVKVPDFLPDHEEIRSDVLDYLYEIEYFDGHIVRALKALEKAGELENTLIISTSDNGMAFPRAKANLYEYGFHVPLAMRWGAKVKAGRHIDDLVGFTDIAPTILEVAGVEHPGAYPMTGKSILNILLSEQTSGIVDESRTEVYASRERHSSSRFRSLSYPQRCIRTSQYLYIRNFKPERWPAGAPQKYGTGGYATPEEIANLTLGPIHGGYHDIDACPTLDFLIENRDHPDYSQFFHWSVDKRPAEELFDIKNDPACINNLASSAEFSGVKEELSNKLENYLKETQDSRILDGGDIWETYPRYSGLRKFPTPLWAEGAKLPEQDWWVERWEE